MEYFNTKQDYESHIRGFDMHQRTRLERALGTETLFMFNDIGEYWTYNRTFIALAHAYPLKDKDGKETNVWDAFEVVKDGQVSRVRLKEGVTKSDGTAFTEEDVQKLTNKNKRIYQKMNGIYNKHDRAAIQQWALGRMAFTFRKFLIPGMNRRFQTSMYDFETDTYSEGFYNTFAQWFTGKAGTKGMWKFWADPNLNETQKANIVRSMVDFLTY